MKSSICYIFENLSRPYIKCCTSDFLYHQLHETLVKYRYVLTTCLTWHDLFLSELIWQWHSELFGALLRCNLWPPVDWFTCALWCLHQSLSEHLPHPRLQLSSAFSAHHRNHQVWGGETPVGGHQSVDHRRGRVPWQPQKLGCRRREGQRQKWMTKMEDILEAGHVYYNKGFG